MRRLRMMLNCVVVFVVLIAGTMLLNFQTSAESSQQPPESVAQERGIIPRERFQVEVLVNGRPLAEYFARNKTYVEALQGAEYELRIRNPLPERIAVALSVDGLNTIDARHTSAWYASKWVIEPFETITIGGWQMSSERARRFYFTNEQDSYAARLGKSSNLGAIAAVFFRERRRQPVPITPPRPIYKEDNGPDRSLEPPSPNSRAGDATAQKRSDVSPKANDDYAATGIGRSVQNEVRWVNMELDSQPVADLTIRYEYYSALLRLGVVPRQYGEDSLRRRERSKGFEDRRFSPEP